MINLNQVVARLAFPEAEDKGGKWVILSDWRFLKESTNSMQHYTRITTAVEYKCKMLHMGHSDVSEDPFCKYLQNQTSLWSI